MKNNSRMFLKVFLPVFFLILIFTGIAYPMGIPLPDPGEVGVQIQSVETAAKGAFSALQGLAGTLGYAPGASGGPLFNPGPGLSQALSTVDRLSADVSKMKEDYQNIIINYDKLKYLVGSVSTAVNSVLNLDQKLDNAISEVTRGLSGNDFDDYLPQYLINNAKYFESIFKNLPKNYSGQGNEFQPGNIISGYPGESGIEFNKSLLAQDSEKFVADSVFNSDGITGNASYTINCQPFNEGYFFKNGKFVSGCLAPSEGFSLDAASSALYNSGLSSARARKAELEADGFMTELADGSLGKNPDFYAYQGAVLTVIAEENAANLKNQGYIESELRQLETAFSAETIERSHVGPVIMPENDTKIDGYYTRTTL